MQKLRWHRLNSTFQMMRSNHDATSDLQQQSLCRALQMYLVLSSGNMSFPLSLTIFHIIFFLYYNLYYYFIEK